MACNWRIRHKLMLGMFLVVAIMALLLGGTLYGLADYRTAMGTCQSKLDELKCADEIKDEIRTLRDIPRESGFQALHVEKCIPKVESALRKYSAQLQDTIDRKRDEGYQEQAYVISLQKDMQKLKDELKKERDGVQYRAEAADLFNDRPAIREIIEETESNASYLISSITDVLNRRIAETRTAARKSIMLLIITGILAVFLMVGNLGFFYRWVAKPIRDLELGVGRVAKGDFQHRIEIHSGDEIEDLANAYNAMTAKLQAIYENLAQQVNERSRQLVRSERLAGVGFLAAGVAHEINNPLASIAFCSEALEGRLSDLLRNVSMSTLDRETIAKYLKMIQEEAFRCKEITQKLLAFSRGGELKRDETDLVEIIQGVLDIVQHLQSSKGKRIDFRPLGPILAWVHGQEIKQVFLNLVINALECMDDGGLLSITHSMHDGQIELVFKDTGCGMTPEVLENIFEPFYTRSRTGKGTGLGLSISHRIISQHGGEIEAASDGPGHGSTFTVRLPIKPAASAADQSKDVNDPVEEFLKLSSAQRSARAA